MRPITGSGRPRRAVASLSSAVPRPFFVAPAGTAKKGLGTALDKLATALRSLPLPVIGRIAEDRLLLDLRCLEDSVPFTAQLDELRERLV